MQNAVFLYGFEKKSLGFEHESFKYIGQAVSVGNFILTSELTFDPVAYYAEGLGKPIYGEIWTCIGYEQVIRDDRVITSEFKILNEYLQPSNNVITAKLIAEEWFDASINPRDQLEVWTRKR